MKGLLTLFVLLAILLAISNSTARKGRVAVKRRLKSPKAANKTENSSRDGRLLSLFQVVTFPNDNCAGNSKNGTCYTSTECDTRGGTASGTCASGYGVCCIFSLTCGGTTRDNCTYLEMTTSTTTTSTSCQYSICKSQSDVCRIRLDFITFSIAGPQLGTVAGTSITTVGGGVGDCATDQFTVTSPGSVGAPVICGINSGQHMIVDASDECNVASFSLDSGTTVAPRSWEVKVTQYSCAEETLVGPSGCLQYFTGNTGRVASYNFPISSSAVGATTTHLSSQEYNICFRQEAGKCGICYAAVIGDSASIDMQSSFGLSISSIAISATSQLDAICTTDYIEIPNLEVSTAPFTIGTMVVGNSRVCGRAFNVIAAGTATDNTLCTQTKPFRITFRTDANEVTTNTMADTNEQAVHPGGIIGFHLAYSQVDC